MPFVWRLLASAAGACISIQAAANASLRNHLNDVRWATFFSICGTMITAVLVMLAIRPNFPSSDVLRFAPWWNWIGGPLGAYLPPAAFDTPLEYEALSGRSALLGHGGVVVFDDTVDMARMARFALEFCAIESCGKCTPCRVGSTRGVELVDRILANRGAGNGELALLDELCDTMANGSLCGLGGLTPFPVRSALKYFPEDFHFSGARAPLSSAAEAASPVKFG